MRWVGGLTVAALCGCTDVASDGLPTGSLKALVEARTWGDGVTAVGVDLKSRKALRDWVELTGDDALYAELDGVERPMVPERRRRRHTYVAWFEGAPTDRPFTVRFERGSGHDAPDTTAFLPEPFELVVGPEVVQLGWDGLEVAWWPTSDSPMTIEVDGDCIDRQTARIGRDRGRHWFSPLALSPADEDWGYRACELLVEVRREGTGELDEAFRGGHAMGVQIRDAVLRAEGW